jgi:cytoskeletal protein CcmA (bactofilin family)
VSSTTVALTRSGGATTVLNKTTKGQEVTGRERNAADTGARVLSIISRDMHIEGNCETDGQLLIEGRISGNVTAHGVEMVASGSVDGNVIAAENAKSTHAFIICGLVTGAVHAALVEVRLGGKVHGGVVADEAVIHGQVHGGVLARNRLALEETAEVEGDVHARRLALKEGGQVNGNISMGERADLEPSRPESAHVADPVAAEDEVLVSAAHGR